LELMLIAHSQAFKSLEGEISETVPEYQDAMEEIR
jgi:hypothetical protein